MDTKDTNTGGGRLPQQDVRHPGEFQRDLEPNRMAGQNVGPDVVDREVPLPSAHELKDVHRMLSDFTDDELKQIRVLPPGTRLQQGATYVDLAAEPREEVKVNAGVVAREGQVLVAKKDVPYTVWNRLLGKPGVAGSE